MMKNDPSRQKLFASPILCGLSDLVTHTSYIDLFLIDKNCIMRYNYNVIVKLGYMCKDLEMPLLKSGRLNEKEKIE